MINCDNINDGDQWFVDSFDIGIVVNKEGLMRQKRGSLSWCKKNIFGFIVVFKR